MSPEHVATENLSRFELSALACNHNLAISVRLVHTERLSVRAEERLQAARRNSLRLALVLRLSDHRSLRRSKYRSRNDVQVNAVVYRTFDILAGHFSHDSVQCPFSLECSHVGKHHTATDITDSENVRNIGPHVRVSNDTLRSELQSDFRKVQRSDIRSAAHSHKNLVSNDFHFLVFLYILDCQFFTITRNALYLG